MPLARAFLAFLDALDGGRTPAGQDTSPAPRAAAPATATVQQPLGPLVESLAARVAALEASVKAFSELASESADRAVRASEAARRAAQRAVARLESSELELEPGDDVPEHDVPGGARGGVQAVPDRVESARGNEAPSVDDWNNAMRARVALM